MTIQQDAVNNIPKDVMNIIYKMISELGMKVLNDEFNFHFGIKQEMKRIKKRYKVEYHWYQKYPPGDIPEDAYIEESKIPSSDEKHEYLMMCWKPWLKIRLGMYRHNRRVSRKLPTIRKEYYSYVSNPASTLDVFTFKGKIYGSFPPFTA